MLAVQFVTIERPQRETAGRVVIERREDAGRVCEAAAAVEESGDRVREQRAAGDRTGDHFGALHEIARHQIDEVLGKAPDRRRGSKELVRVEVDASVVAVPVVEVAVDHQHPRLPQVVQRLLAQFRAFVHCCSSRRVHPCQPQMSRATSGLR
jgi:hypothetical protein